MSDRPVLDGHFAAVDASCDFAPHGVVPRVEDIGRLLGHPRASSGLSFAARTLVAVPHPLAGRPFDSYDRLDPDDFEALKPHAKEAADPIGGCIFMHHAQRMMCADLRSERAPSRRYARGPSRATIAFMRADPVIWRSAAAALHVVPQSLILVLGGVPTGVPKRQTAPDGLTRLFLVDPTDPADLDRVHAPQDAISIDQAQAGQLDLPDWDQDARSNRMLPPTARLSERDPSCGGWIDDRASSAVGTGHNQHDDSPSGAFVFCVVGAAAIVVLAAGGVCAATPDAAWAV